MDDRRQFPRFKVGVECQWKKITDPTEKTAQNISHAKDISAGGVCLVLHSGIVKGDILQLEIKRPRGTNLVLKGKVVWITHEGKVAGRKDAICEGGVQFLDIDEARVNELTQFLISSATGGPRK